MTKLLERAVPTEITYVDAKGVETTRVILPHTIPAQNVWALDVSSLNQDEVQQVTATLVEYQQYRDGIISTVFSFNEFIEQTRPTEDIHDYAWRSFNRDNITIS